MTFFSSSSSPSGTTVSEIACDPKSGIKLLIETPVNSSNFKGYNRTTDTIDTSHLGQPINESGYDSETQACIDLLDSKHKDGPPPSFYDHFVNQPVKKKDMKGVTLEEPVLNWGRAPPPPATPEGTTNTSESCACGGAIPPQGPLPSDVMVDYLAVPPQLEVPQHRCTDGGHALLDNPDARRLATGKMPPKCV